MSSGSRGWLAPILCLVLRAHLTEPSVARRSVEHGSDLGQRGLPDAGSHAPALEVVEGRMNPTPQPRLTRLVRCVVVAGPLQGHGRRRTLFEEQIARVERIAAETTGEVLRAREPAQDGG